MVVEEVYLVIMEIFLVVAVGGALYGYVLSEANDMSFHKRVFARDLSYTLEAVEGIPGDMTLYYSPSGEQAVDLNYNVLTPKVTFYEGPKSCPIVAHPDTCGTPRSLSPAWSTSSGSPAGRHCRVSQSDPAF